MKTRSAEDWEHLIDIIQAEGPISMGEAARLVPRSVRRKSGGRRKHASTRSVVRWIVEGLPGVRLEGAMLNGESWFTSKAAIARFQAALSQRAVAGVEEALAEGTPMQRESRAEASDREFEMELARR